MAKRSSTTTQTKKPAATRSSASEARRQNRPTSVMERQVLAFAEQLGYVAGSIQSKAGGLP